MKNLEGVVQMVRHNPRSDHPGPDLICPHCGAGYMWNELGRMANLVYSDGYLRVLHKECDRCGNVMEAKGVLSFNGYLGLVRSNPDEALKEVDDYETLREMGKAERRLS